MCLSDGESYFAIGGEKRPLTAQKSEFRQVPAIDPPKEWALGRRGFRRFQDTLEEAYQAAWGVMPPPIKRLFDGPLRSARVRAEIGSAETRAGRLRRSSAALPQLPQSGSPVAVGPEEAES